MQTLPLQETDLVTSDSSLSIQSNSDDSSQLSKSYDQINLEKNLLSSQPNIYPSNQLQTSEFIFEMESSFLETKQIENSKNQIILNATQEVNAKKAEHKTNQQIKFDRTFDLSNILKLLDDQEQQKQCQKFVSRKQDKMIKSPLREQNQNKTIFQSQIQIKEEQNQKKTIFKRQAQKKETKMFNSSKQVPCRDHVSRNTRQINKSSRFNTKHHMNYPKKLIYPQMHNFSNFYSSQHDFIPMKKSMKNYGKSYGEQFASSNFVFWNVLISIKLCSYFSLRKNVLLVPFSSNQFKNSISKTITQCLKYNMKEVINLQAAKIKQKQLPEGYVFSVKAKGLENNYRGIYFIKSPENSKTNLKYYEIGSLKTGIQNAFNLVNFHMEENIIFPDVEWGNLNQNQICQTLIWSIFREISENKKNYRCPALRQVIISANNCENFELYSNWLKAYVNELRS